MTRTDANRIHKGLAGASRGRPQTFSIWWIRPSEAFWNARWFSAMTNHTVISNQEPPASATICGRDGFSIEASTA